MDILLINTLHMLEPINDIQTITNFAKTNKFNFVNVNKYINKNLSEITQTYKSIIDKSNNTRIFNYFHHVKILKTYKKNENDDIFEFFKLALFRKHKKYVYYPKNDKKFSTTKQKKYLLKLQHLKLKLNKLPKKSQTDLEKKIRKSYIRKIARQRENITIINEYTLIKYSLEKIIVFLNLQNLFNDVKLLNSNEIYSYASEDNDNLDHC